ncbi:MULTISPECIES: ABC transporter ATP-binding protein [Enterobacteriaceae]|uniref:ATP-binding cassette domain-containing protein n=1 Tax=Atlantibacter subterraneus TaxID=255519 RepID=A0A3R9F606_9ENTR|nr:oligopeptide/dipeptide ABC transporter ATP-binding protein [Atlantibacter subterranea]MDA3133333.1 ATP-binding cassette domain-containing protein [Atlantibacter subterranea]MDW2743144.1 ATP-binding cassette domain-containing protein [Atlantibacter subterranea]RSB62559.1 ATP-binding cassette domain-containing protein [Atlantibacter subterranea]RSE03507.1 ATP-binding cassette domain-containing protein [Atlantibacter subterranea]RSE26789.1 ATP-binding cassette domain-containing protein [Atlant
MNTLLEAEGLSVRYPVKGGWVHAVTEVDLQLRAGETVGLVGESGCGKSTLGKALMRLIPAQGQLRLNGDDVLSRQGRQLLPFRRHVQMMFQDPQGSLNPRQRVGTSIARPLEVAGWSRDAIQVRIAELLEVVGLPASAATRFPHEFSGGQRQRIGIARALALEPSIVICDEPVSALDVSVRAQVINLMRDIQQQSHVAYLFISHDLSVVEYIAHRVMVMYLGRVVESGPTAQIWAAPAHPYTQALLAAAPVADPRHPRGESLLEGELPSPLAPPSGCAFHTRCPYAQPLCQQQRPPLQSLTSERQVACHFHLS